MTKIRKLKLLQDYYLIYRSFLFLAIVFYLGPKHLERVQPTLLSPYSVAFSTGGKLKESRKQPTLQGRLAEMAFLSLRCCPLECW